MVLHERLSWLKPALPSHRGRNDYRSGVDIAKLEASMIPSGHFHEHRSVLFGAYRGVVVDLRPNRQRTASTAVSAEARSRPVRVPLFRVLIRRVTLHLGGFDGFTQLYRFQCCLYTSLAICIFGSRRRVRGQSQDRCDGGDNQRDEWDRIKMIRRR